MESYFAIGFIGALIALAFAQSRRVAVMSCSEGNERMQKIASAIRDGANAYLKQQYSTV
ncbi:MAG: sodium/proton-translocating pyrophosphatase, partial [Lachnospiraceae bacterium]